MPRKSKKVHVADPATASEIRKALKISKSDIKETRKALEATKDNRTSFEKLIDKLTELTDQDVAVWRKEVFLYKCKLGNDEFAVDNLQDSRPVFYITNESGQSTVDSYRLRPLIHAIFEQESRNKPRLQPNPLIEAEEIKKEQKVMEFCGETLGRLNRLFRKKKNLNKKK